MQQQTAINPDTALEGVMATIRQLFTVYERETEALENVDTNTFLSLQDEKITSARAYQTGMENLLARKDEIRKASPATKQRFEQMQADFSALSQRNMEALSRMRRTMDRLGETLRRVAKDTARKQQVISYGADGTLREDDRKRISTGVSETA